MEESRAAQRIGDYPVPGSIRRPEVVRMLEERAARFQVMSHRYFAAKAKKGER